MAIGGVGVISVVANILPRPVEQMIRAFEAGRLGVSRRWHYRLLPLTKALFLETNPIPVKTAMGLMGRIDPELRLPLCPMGEANQEKLKAVLSQYRLISGRKPR